MSYEAQNGKRRKRKRKKKRTIPINPKAINRKKQIKVFNLRSLCYR